jgi:hypothetical protein
MRRGTVDEGGHPDHWIAPSFVDGVRVLAAVLDSDRRRFRTPGRHLVGHAVEPELVGLVRVEPVCGADVDPQGEFGVIGVEVCPAVRAARDVG